MGASPLFGGLAVVELLAAHVDGLVEVVDEHLVGYAVDPTGKGANALDQVQLALHRVFCK